MVSKPLWEKKHSTIDAAPSEMATCPAGPTVVLGGPGTGKTTTLVERVADLIASGVPKDRILVLGLSRRGAEELASRLVLRLGTDAPQATTLHSLCLRLVRGHFREAGYHRPPRALSGRESWRHLAAAMEREPPSLWSRYGRALHSPALQALANDLLAGSAYNALTFEEVVHRLDALGRPDLHEIVRFLDRHLQRLKAQALVPMEWIPVEALRLLELQPEVAASFHDRYPHLIVDDLQDATYTQARLVASLHGDGLFAAGSPEQCINSFQGGSPTHLLRLVASPAFRVVHLSTCYRSSPAIERACRRLMGEDAVQSNGERSGDVVACGFAHQGEEPAWIAREILSLLRRGAQLQQIAVLFRSRTDPVARELSRHLARMGIPVHASCETPSADKDPLVRSAVELLRYLVSPDDARDPIFERLLSSPLCGLTAAELRTLRRRAAQVGVSIHSAVGRQDLLGGLPPHVAATVVDLSTRLSQLQPHADNPPTELLWRVWTTFPAFAAQAIASSDERAEETVGSPAAYRAFLEEADAILRDSPHATISDLLALYDGGSFSEVLVEPVRHRDAGITLTTIHQARGREWEFVFLPNMVEGVYPLRASPLGNLIPLLLRDGERETPSPRDLHLAEERRVVLAGLSRARRRVYLTYSTTASDGTTRLTPSRYLTSIQPEEVRAGSAAGNDRDEMLAHYRRRLRAADPAAQAQALYALARLSDLFPARIDPSLWWDTVDETAGADPPYPSGSLHLSASRLSSYRVCPLQFKFAHHLWLEDVASDTMTLGTLVHDVLRAYHDPKAAHPRDWGSLQTLLDRIYDPTAFSRPVIARQARRRAEELLSNYFSRYGHSSMVVAVETSFRFRLDAHWVTGRIDRIDRGADGTLELIDYKTGSSAMSKDEAQQDIQLALYDLAFQFDPQFRELGTPSRAAYLYLQKIGPRSDGKRSFCPTDEARWKLMDRIRSFASGILSETFPSRFQILETWPDLDPVEIEKVWTSNPCRICAFVWLCPEMERGQGDE